MNDMKGRRPPLWIVCYFVIFTAGAAAQPGPMEVRPVPPPGIALASAEKANLLGEIQQLNEAIAELKADLKGEPAILSFLPDIEVFEKAVRYAVTYNEFYSTNEIPIAYRRSGSCQLSSKNPASTT